MEEDRRIGVASSVSGRSWKGLFSLTSEQTGGKPQSLRSTTGVVEGGVSGSWFCEQ